MHYLDHFANHFTHELTNRSISFVSKHYLALTS